MKKVLLGIVVLLVMVVMSFLISGIIKKLQSQKLISEKISSLPPFTFLTLSYESYRSIQIQKGPVLIVHFHPECEHCRYEISEILKSKIPVSFSTVILVSSAHPDSIRSFFSNFNLTDYSSVIPLLDTLYEFEEIFGSAIIPSTFIYNRNLNLVKVLHGEVKTDAIIKYLQESE